MMKRFWSGRQVLKRALCGTLLVLAGICAFPVLGAIDTGKIRVSVASVTPQPESLLRIFMAWKPSTRPVTISAPVIQPFTRKGFTVVEWGGTKVAPY